MFKSVISIGIATVFVSTGVFTAAIPASALATPENDGLTTIGNVCFSNPEEADGQSCRTHLITRTTFFALRDYTIFISGSLTGPTGSINVNPKYDAWANRPPVDDYKGLSFNTTIFNDGFESLPAGTYTYTLNVSLPRQWTCSKFNANGCRYIDADYRNYIYNFTWDGVNTITVAPQWEVKLTAAVSEKSVLGRAVDLFYQTNAPKGTVVLIQRRQGGGKWKTVKRATIPLFSLSEGAPFFSDTKVKQGTYFYRLIFKTTGGDSVTNLRKARVR